MSEGQSIQSARQAAPHVRAAIARAAAATGTDFRYLLAEAALESGFDPAADARTSSAAGLFQFTEGTWLETVDRHGSRHGIYDRASRQGVLALRYDPEPSARMAAELAGENRAGLASVLGREPNDPELYLAHFLGLGGARKFLAQLAVDPSQSAAAILPRAAEANRAIFYDDGSPRSLAQVMDLISTRFAGAMEDAGSPTGAGSWPLSGSPVLAGGRGNSVSAGGIETESAFGSRSMAETLRAAFGGDREGDAAPASIGSAYAKFARLGL